MAEKKSSKTNKEKEKKSATKKSSTTSKKTTISKKSSTTKKVATKKVTTTKPKKKPEISDKPRKKITIASKKAKVTEGLQEISTETNLLTLTTEVAYFYLEPGFDTYKLIRWLNQYHPLTWSIASALHDRDANKHLQVIQDKMYLVNLELIEDSYLVLVPANGLDKQIHIACLSKEKFEQVCK